MVVVAVVRWEEDDNTLALNDRSVLDRTVAFINRDSSGGLQTGFVSTHSEWEGLCTLGFRARLVAAWSSAWSLVRPGRLPCGATNFAGAEIVVCRVDVSAADVERFGAWLSSEQRALVTFFTTDDVKFTAWPELVRLFPNLGRVDASRCGLVEFPLAVCALPNLRRFGLACNDFVAVPFEVSRLQQLERLYLYGCTRLQRLPSSISTLTALTALDVRDCNKLPKEFNAYFDGDEVQGALVKMSRHFARLEHCRAACVTLIGLRRSRQDTILLSQPLDITVLVAKLLWQARDEWPVV